MMFKFDKLLLLCFAIPVGLDRVTKYLVLSDVWPDQAITSFLEVYLTFNRGVSWGIGSSSDLMQFFTITAIVGFVILLFAWYVYKNFVNRVAMGSSLIILSGAVSNFYDRIYFGGVVDFIRFHYGSWSFPVFNVADIFISAGTFLLLCIHLFDDQQ